MSDLSGFPLWILGLLALGAVVWGLMLLWLPFALMGARGRIDALRAEIAEMRAELRVFSRRLAALGVPETALADVGVDDRHSTLRDVTASAHFRAAVMEGDDLMAATVLRQDLPSYEDTPQIPDPESLPRRGPAAAASAGSRSDGGAGSPERVWSRAPWETRGEVERAPLRGNGRPVGGGGRIERMQPPPTRADDEAFRPRAEPKLRWPPRD